MLYDVAAGVLKGIDDRTGSIKTLVLGSSYQNKKQLYALVCETLKYRQVLEELITSCSSLKLENKLRKSKHLMLVLLHDFLIGTGVRGAPKYKKVLDSCKALLHAELERIKVKRKVSSVQSLKASDDVSLPRYVRINTLRVTEQQAVEALVSAGYCVLQPPSDIDSFFSAVSSLKSKEFMKDIHVSNLYAFASNADFHENPLYLDGTLILQDKASCIPAAVLSPRPGCMAIDACAAPGNKTSHMAALMENRGTIHAFELDQKRFTLMKTLLGKAGVTCVRPHLGDFTKCSPCDSDCSSAEYILVDPSCSGSGIVSRMNSLTDAEDNTVPVKAADRQPAGAATAAATAASCDRLQRLATFQKAVLEHALSFPAARRVVYSTCSVHEEENEQVVAAVLEKFAHSYHLEQVLPNWPYRGSNGGNRFGDMSTCIRASLSRTRTNGFFVAAFVRNSELADDVPRVQLETRLLSSAMSSNGQQRRSRSKPSKRQRKRLRTSRAAE